jgi:hypothetical protein
MKNNKSKIIRKIVNLLVDNNITLQDIVNEYHRVNIKKKGKVI